VFRERDGEKEKGTEKKVTASRKGKARKEKESTRLPCYGDKGTKTAL
jgi:hypothetical protein